MPDTKYSSLISQVISDFDSIFKAMADKKVDDNGTQISDRYGQASGIATSNYGSIISTQLFRVGKPTLNGEKVDYVFNNKPTLTEGVIRDYSEEASTALTPTLDNGTGVVTFNIPAAGYYDTSSSIKTTFEIESKTIDTLSGALDGYYVVSPTAGKVLSSVKIKKGGVVLGDKKYTVTTTGADGSGEESLTNETVINAAGTSITASETQITGGYTLKIDNSFNHKAKITATPNLDVTTGWVETADVSVENAEINIDKSGTNSKTFYIGKGSISASLSGNPTITHTAQSGLELVDSGTVGADTANYYKISTATSKLDIVGDVVEGYVKPEADGTKTDLGSVNPLEAETYIKKGNVVDGTFSVGDKLELTSTIAHTTKATNDYEITLNVAENTKYTGTVEPGYIPSTKTSYDVGLSGTKTVYVSKGSVSANAELTLTQEDPNAILKSDGEYSVIVKPTLDFSKAVITPGYIPTGSAIEGTSSLSDLTLHFAKAKINCTIGKPTATLHDVEGDGSGSSSVDGTVVDIFQTSAPAKGDYYEIKVPAPSTHSVTQGFIKDGSEITVTQSDSIFLPKAKAEWVVGEDGEGYLDIKTGGYLPSGSITDITQVEMTPATVTAAISDDGSITLGSAPTSGEFYTITIGKGATSSGYISDTKGTVSGKAYVTKGSIKVSNESKTFVATTIDENANKLSILAKDVSKTADGTGYQFGVKETVGTSVEQTIGYVKASEVKVNNGEAGSLTENVEFTNTISLPKAVYGLNEESTQLTVSATPSSGIESKTASEDGYNKYSVSTTVDGSVEIKATGSGWLSTEEDGTTVAISGGTGSGNVYLKTGTGPSKTDWSGASNKLSTGAFTNNFGTTQTGDYTISVNGTVDTALTLGTGYYGTAEASHAGTAKVVDSVSVAHGNAQIAASATVQTSKSTNLTTYSSGTETDYVFVGADITNFKTETTVKEGYLKKADVTEASEITAEGAKVWIKKYTGDLSTEELTKVKDVSGTEFSGNVFTGITLGSKTGNIDESTSVALKADTNTTAGLRDVAYVDVSAKYATNNIEVKLTPDAMGSSVVTELAKLQSRLAGTMTITQ